MWLEMQWTNGRQRIHRRKRLQWLLDHKVLATELDLALLRTWARWLCQDPQRRLRLVADAGETPRRLQFAAKTLLHFGASCAQIQVQSGHAATVLSSASVHPGASP